MPLLVCMVFVVLILVGPGPVGAVELAATGEAFRTESLPRAGNTAESAWSLMPRAEEGSSHLDHSLVTLHYLPDVRVAQVAGAPTGTPSGSPAPEREEEGAS